MVSNNVIQIVPALLLGGLESLSFDLYAKGKMQHSLISLQYDAEQTFASFPQLQSAEQHCHFIDKNPGMRWSTVQKISRLIKTINPSVLHTHNEGPLFYGSLAGRLNGIKRHIHTFHDTWVFETPMERLYAKLMARLTKPIFVVPEKNLITAIKAVFPQAMVVAIQNGVDVVKYHSSERLLARDNLKLPKDNKIIGCAARFSVEKGHKYLIAALCKLPDDIHLALAGVGPEYTAIETLAQQLGVAGRVHFLNNISDMPEFYSALDLFCLPSLKVGLPLAPLEAQACGVPVVLTDVGSAVKALDRQSGLAVEAKSPEALAAAITSVLSHAVDLSPREYIKENFNIETTVKAYEELYLGDYTKW